MSTLHLADPDYPILLQETAHPPDTLYYRGNIQLLNSPCIAIVGSRAMTAYGERVCTNLVHELVQHGLTIVSGLATGIDAVAHRTAIADHGNTIAVLGCGLDTNVIFPADHRQLADQIVANNSVLISEYSDQVRAQRHQFPARNRIIAGLSLGTVVIEAATKSGALITAHKALEANREVFAVPGSIFSSRSTGVHDLIKQGAVLVETVADILQALNLSSAQLLATTTNKLQQLSLDQQAIIQQIQTGYSTPEQLVNQLHWTASAIIVHLTDLEIQGIVRKNPNQHYEIFQ